MLPIRLPTLQRFFAPALFLYTGGQGRVSVIYDGNVIHTTVRPLRRLFAPQQFASVTTIRTIQLLLEYPDLQPATIYTKVLDVIERATTPLDA